MGEFIRMARRSVLNRFTLFVLIILGSAYAMDRMLDFTSIRMSGFTVRQTGPSAESGPGNPVNLPFTSPSSTDTAEFTYTGTITHAPQRNSKVKIIADDVVTSIRINGAEFPLGTLARNPNGDWAEGFIADFSPFLLPGINGIEIRVADKGMKYGLEIGNVDTFFLNPFVIPFLALFSGAAMLLAWSILSKTRLDKVSKWIVLAGLFGHLTLLVAVNWDRATFDLQEGGTGHLDYIESIAKEGTLPPPDGWSFYHPPLYYLTGAVVWKACDLAGVSNKEKALQGLSLLYFCGFWFFGILILRRFIPEGPVFRASLALLVFWPSGFIHAIRIGNDVAFYFFFAAALYFILEWYRSGVFRQLMAAAVLTALTLLVKTNGIILCGVLGILLVLDLIRGNDIAAGLKKILLTALICLSGFLLGSIDNYIAARDRGDGNWAFAGLINTVSSADPSLYCENRPANYLLFDPLTFIVKPYVSSRDDSTGRWSFWNYLAKSSLFSEFYYPSPWNLTLARIISLLFLLLSLLFAAGCFHLFRSRFPFRQTDAPERKGYFPLLLTLFIGIAALLALRVKNSMPCLGDFRYVYPLVLPGIAMVAAAIEAYGNFGKGAFRKWAIACCYAFAGASLLFFG